MNFVVEPGFSYFVTRGIFIGAKEGGWEYVGEVVEQIGAEGEGGFQSTRVFRRPNRTSNTPREQQEQQEQQEQDQAQKPRDAVFGHPTPRAKKVQGALSRSIVWTDCPLCAERKARGFSSCCLEHCLCESCSSSRAVRDIFEPIAPPAEVPSTLPDSRLADKEPVFVLRAQDQLAPELVREWIHRARVNGVSADKITSAVSVAETMEEWQVRHARKMPD